jgi:pimeloyl-ACP methyl ester carboxylesterase
MSKSRAVGRMVGVLMALAAGAAGVSAGQEVPRPPDVPPEARDARPQRELVVLVHGLGRTPASMSLMERSLRQEGFLVLNWGYSSTCCTLAELGTRLGDALREPDGSPPDRIHFVGHSLGNLVIRWMLAHRPPPVALGRMVMLAPPNRGSSAADRYAPYLGKLLKPLPELRTDDEATARSLPPLQMETAVIAGRFDGKVSVEETRIEGLAGHVVLPAAHTFLMNRADTRRLTVGFLREGRF